MRGYPLIIGLLLALSTAALAADAPPAGPAVPAPVVAPAPTPPPSVAGDVLKPITPLAKVESIAVVLIRGEVDSGLEYSIRRRVADARAAGARLIIFDIDTLGGDLFSAWQMADYVGNLKTPTVAYISNNAISAGALFAISCDQIVVKTISTFGDCEPISPGGEKGYITLGEKFQTKLRADFRKFADQHGYSPLLSEAMVTKELSVWRVSRNDRKEYLDQTQYDLLTKALTPQQVTALEPRQVVSAAQLLTMTASEAQEYGFARAIVDNQEQAIDLYLAPGGKVETLATNWSEQLVRFLNNGAVTSLLMMVGLVAVYFALKVPGVGVPEAVAVLCFGTLFLSKYLIGLANVFDIVLVCVGFGLLAVEILLIPGFGLPGILGIACVIVGLILMMQRFTIPEYSFQVNILVENVVVVLGSLVGSLIGFVVLVRLLPSTPYLNRLALKTTQTVEGGYTVSRPEAEALAGREGVAATDLRPAGRVEIGDEFVDVVTQGEYIEAGERVRVIEVRGTRVVVARRE